MKMRSSKSRKPQLFLTVPQEDDIGINVIFASKFSSYRGVWHIIGMNFMNREYSPKERNAEKMRN